MLVENFFLIHSYFISLQSYNKKNYSGGEYGFYYVRV